ncbi:hypothetical protein CRM22_007972 [Opisthorchis felineus]|uniref:Uncharacterized protein n=1 Tax=Opisthorchis felineus TaxID=147828 RepID=A0A4S2LFF3_OPIFE|nr:hypothetical protein CRM22_007972 [Opisthorchis felineus]
MLVPKFSIVLGGTVVWRDGDVIWSPTLDDKTSTERMDLTRSLCHNLKDQILRRSNVTAIPTSCEMLWINHEDNNAISYMEYDQKLPLVLEDLYKIFLPNEVTDDAHYKTVTHYQLGAEVTNSECKKCL